MIGSEAVISILGFTMIGVAGLLRLLPVGTCSECPHCRLARFEHEREMDGARSMSGPFCAICGRHHRPGEDHHS